MRAEERHELRENDLAGWLQFGLWGFLRQYGSYLLLVLALCLLGYTLWQRHLQTKENERLTAFADFNNAKIDSNEIPATNDKDQPYKALGLLPEMVDDSPYPEIKVQAALELGKIYNRIAFDLQSQEQLKMTRDAALGKAYEMYEKALALKGDDPLIAGKAHLGMAGVHEDKGEWDEAADEYKKLIDDPKFAGPIADLAKARLESLQARHNAPRLAAMRPPSTQPTMPGIGLPNINGVSGAPGAGFPIGPGIVPGAPLPGLIGPTLPPATGVGSGPQILSPGMGLSPYPLTAPPTSPVAPPSTQPK